MGMDLTSSTSQGNQFAREKWYEASHFAESDTDKVLGLVRARLAGHRKTSLDTKPWVLFDLDSTLYDVAPRTHAILQDFLTETNILSSALRERLIGVTKKHVGYGLKDTFTAVGLDLESPEVKSALHTAKEFWWDRFFSNQYLSHDLAYEGAADYVNELHELGARIIYLTGRERSLMVEGTLKNLERDGFPRENATLLLMKENSAVDDLTHKILAAQSLRQYGECVASFENEPKNLVAIHQLYPRALHIFVRTMCSDLPAVPLKGIYGIQGFSRVLTET